MSDWSRIGKSYLFEKSIFDKDKNQLTLLQSHQNIVCAIDHKKKHMVRTMKHYSYSITDELIKIIKKDKLVDIQLEPTSFKHYLCSHYGEDNIYLSSEQDVQFTGDEDDIILCTPEPNDDDDGELPF